MQACQLLRWIVLAVLLVHLAHSTRISGDCTGTPDIGRAAHLRALRGALPSSKPAVAPEADHWPGAPAVCHMNIKGAPDGSISSASLKCSGGPVNITVREELLGQYAGSFQGARVLSKQDAECLLEVTSTAPVEFVDSVVERVTDSHPKHLQALFCAYGDSRATILHSRIAHNTGFVAVGVGGKAQVVFTATEISHNVARGISSAMEVSHNAYVLITADSLVSGNMALSSSGGAISVLKNASLVISGASSVFNNTSFNASGGGVSVRDTARFRLEGGSAVMNNTSINYNGGGIVARGDSKVLITGHSRVTGNAAMGKWAGGIIAHGNASVVVSNGSIIGWNTASHGEGGIGLRDSTSFVLSHSSIEGNTALQGSGGGLALSLSASAIITHGSRIAHNRALHGTGGGIDADGGNVSVHITQGSFVFNNTAVNASGGGVSVWDMATFRLEAGSAVMNNTSTNFNGGGIYAGGNSKTVVTGHSRVTGNAAVDASGGGVLVHGNASIVVSKESVIGWNRATYGHAGVRLLENAMFVLSHSSIEGNLALSASGGGLGLDHNASGIVTDGSSITHNVVDWGDGGGVDVAGNASLLVEHRSQISHNLINKGTGAGGGVALKGNSHAVITGGSVVGQNTAKNGTGGGVAVADNASLLLTDGSVVIGNSANNGSGGGLRVSHNASVIIVGNSSVVRNTALAAPGSQYKDVWGGGIWVFGNGSVNISDRSFVDNNMAAENGGGIWADNNVSVSILEGSRVASNLAAAEGGGIYAGGNATLLIAGQSSLESNRALKDSGGGLYLVGNASLLVKGGSRLSGNTAVNGSGGGVYLTGTTSARFTENSAITDNVGDGAMSVSDHANAVIQGGSIIKGNAGTADSVIQVWSNASLTLLEGVRLQNNRKAGTLAQFNFGERDVILYNGAKFVTDGSITVDAKSLTFCSDRVWKVPKVNPTANLSQFMMPGGCGPGLYRELMSCQCCPASTFSFDPNTTLEMCRSCPAFAVCPGGDVVLPQAGFWHSAPWSVQIHQCPLQTASCGEAGICKQGFHGSLCAQCAQGYGMSLPFRCAQCMAPRRQLALYILLSCLTVLFIAVTVYFTWRDSCQGAAHLRASDLLKILVQFLQYMIILGSVAAPWPAIMKSLFASFSVVFGAASGQALSVDCWLSQYVQASTLPLAVERQLVSFIAPAVVAFCVFLLYALWSACCCVQFRVSCVRPRRCRLTLTPVRARVAQLLRQLPVIAIVVVYFAYPTLVRASLSFFACVRIDDASQGPYAEYAVLNHTAGYWMYDMSQECFAGYHKAWAMGLGLPAVLVLCVALPIVLFLFLHANASKTAEPAFRERFGFLYRNYKQSKVWWEAVWAAQTVLLTAVAVFHYSIKSYYSIILLTVMFLGSAVLQAVAKPCAEPQLHYLQLAATSCLYLTSLCTLALFNVEGYALYSPVAPVAIGVILIVMNCLFVLVCLLVITKSAIEPGGVVCRVVGKCVACGQRLKCPAVLHASIGSIYGFLRECTACSYGGGAAVPQPSGSPGSALHPPLLSKGAALPQQV